MVNVAMDDNDIIIREANLLSSFRALEYFLKPLAESVQAVFELLQTDLILEAPQASCKQRSFDLLSAKEGPRKKIDKAI